MLPKRAAVRSLSPSTRNMVASAASQSFNARSATALSTGLTSPGDAEITRRISLTAACCSNASARRCLSCGPVEPSIFRDFLVTVGLASTLAFADFAPCSIGPLATLRRYDSAAIDHSLRRRTVSRKSACSVAGAALHARPNGARGKNLECQSVEMTVLERRVCRLRVDCVRRMAAISDFAGGPLLAVSDS